MMCAHGAGAPEDEEDAEVEAAVEGELAPLLLPLGLVAEEAGAEPEPVLEPEGVLEAAEFWVEEGVPELVKAGVEVRVTPCQSASVTAANV